MLNEKADKRNDKEFKITEYIKQNFGMFSGETVKAKIVFDESLVSIVLDQFGTDTILRPHEDNKFIINVSVAATPVFLSWIFLFGNQAEILEPESLRENMRNMIETSNSIYGGR